MKSYKFFVKSYKIFENQSFIFAKLRNLEQSYIQSFQCITIFKFTFQQNKKIVLVSLYVPLRTKKRNTEMCKKMSEREIE